MQPYSEPQWWKRFLPELLISAAAQMIIELAMRGLPLLIFLFVSWISTVTNALLYGIISFFVMYPLVSIFRILIQHQRDIMGLANPYLKILKKEVVCKINKNRGCVRRDTTIIKAMKNGVLDQYIFRVRKTRARDITITATKESGELTSFNLPTTTEYIVKFARLLKRENKNLEHTIITDWRVSSVEEAPYIDVSFSNSRGCDFLSYRVTFPKSDLPHEVYFYKTDLNLNSVSNPMPIPLENDHDDPNRMSASIALTDAAVDSFHKYILMWEW